MAKKDTQGTPGATLERALSELHTYIEDADDFLSSELEESWEYAERYYKGGTDLEEIEHRSNAVKTEVRDAIRNTLPSVMRTLLHSRKIVEYKPSSLQHAPWVEQQSEFVNQLFWACDGYNQLYTAIFEAAKLKLGILKASWESNPKSNYQRYTKVPMTFVEKMIADPNFEVIDYEVAEDEPNAEPNEGSGGTTTLYDVEGRYWAENGRIMLEAVPNYEFFISRNVNSIQQALERGVHGQKGLISVSEALELGLPEDTDWLNLTDDDPEQDTHSSSSQARRGYVKTSPNDIAPVDVLKHQFTLTEVYAAYDLKGLGQTQIYKFYLGGTGYTYLHHEEVEDSPYALVTPNPTPFTVYGDSITDLTINEQDTSTSLLRALIDNAHASNGTKIAADPAKTNFDDLMNPALNAPIRKRSGDTLQIMQIPFTGQGNLATLQYLDQDVQNKVGITKAAQGLDPDAMQSTDKQAVMNTIMTSQGQTELFVRNVIETGLVRLFSILLRLSIRHRAPMQLMHTKGTVVPINQTVFDPDAVAIPNVGLGTASPQQKIAALSWVYNEQKGFIDKLGPNNPFTSYAQMYNTLEDIMEAHALYNVGRHFKHVTPEVEAKWAEAQQKQNQAKQKAAMESQPMDPSKAYLTVEAQKRQIDKMNLLQEGRNKAATQEFDALAKAEELDIKRDELVQKRVIEFAKLSKETENDKVKQEQAANERISKGNSSGSKESS